MALPQSFLSISVKIMQDLPQTCITIMKGDVLSVHTPNDAVSHIKGNRDVFTLDAVKNISRNNSRAIHIYIDDTSFQPPIDGTAEQ